MKKFKLSLLAICLMAISTIGMSFLAVAPASEPTPTPKFKFFTTDYYTWSSSDFTVSTSPGGSDPNLLDDADKWSGPSSSAPSCPSPIDLLCAAQVDYTLTGMQTAPTEQQIIDEIRSKYIALRAQNPSQTFTNNYSWTVTIGGVSVTITIKLKS